MRRASKSPWVIRRIEPENPKSPVSVLFYTLHENPVSIARNRYGYICLSKILGSKQLIHPNSKSSGADL